MNPAVIQRLLGIPVTGLVDATTLRAVREFQRDSGMVVTGELDEATEAAIRRLPTRDLTPTWFCGPEHERVVRDRVGDPDAVRRLQSAAGLVPTGEVDERTARLIGD